MVNNPEEIPSKTNFVGHNVPSNCGLSFSRKKNITNTIIKADENMDMIPDTPKMSERSSIDKYWKKLVTPPLSPTNSPITERLDLCEY